MTLLESNITKIYKSGRELRKGLGDNNKAIMSSQSVKVNFKIKISTMLNKIDLKQSNSLEVILVKEDKTTLIFITWTKKKILNQPNSS